MIKKFFMLLKRKYMRMKIFLKVKLRKNMESFFVSGKIFNADYMITSTIQMVIIVSFFVLAEFAKRHLGMYLSSDNINRNRIEKLLFGFECYMTLLMFFLFIQSVMLFYKRFINITFTVFYAIYYVGIIVLGGSVIFLLKQ